MAPTRGCPPPPYRSQIVAKLWRSGNGCQGLDPTEILVRKLEGHYAYYGITGNGQCLEQVRTGTQKLWRKWLARRSRESQSMTWERMNRFLKETFLFPYARVVHSIYRAKP